MSEIITPDNVVGELNRLMAESAKGVEALFQAETKVAQLEADYDRALSLAQLEASGTALDRQAAAKLACVDLKFALDIARAEFNRIKMKLRTIESAQVAVSVIAKQVELTFRHG
jgi:hypothetical protein